MTGIWTSIKLILRRDRVKLPVWLLGIVGTYLWMIPMLRDIYSDPAALATLHTTFGTNPAGLFLTGPMDAPTFGALVTIETILWWGLAVALMNTLLVVRHTRQNEEMGAQELILSGRIHRSSGLTAVILVAVGVNALLAISLGVGMATIEQSWSTSQSWLYGIALGLFGLAWAAIAALIAQMTENTRTANGILAGLIGGAFAVRGIGDFMGKADPTGLWQAAWPSWITPFGWLQATRSLTFPDWSPLIITLVFVGLATPAAFLLLSRRDIGAGILPPRQGAARAGKLLQTPLGLTLRLQKNIFTGWLAGVLAMIICIGYLTPEMTSIYESSDQMRAMIEGMGGGGALLPAFLSAMLMITVLLVIGYAIHALTKLRSEESSGHLENLLATKLSRLEWLGLHAAVALTGGLIMLIVSGAGLALFVNLASSHQVSIWQYTSASLSYAPLLYVFVGSYLMLFGLWPHLSNWLLWTYYGFMVFMSWVGQILKLNQKIMNLSIMESLPSVPAEDTIIKPLLIMCLVAAIFIVVGSTLFYRRNLATTTS